MPGVLRRFGAPKIIYLAAVISIVIQPLLVISAHALEEGNSVQSNDAPHAPVGGNPHGEVKPDMNFTFSWTAPVGEQGLRYQLRISHDESQVGEAPDASQAWYSFNLPETNMPASDISDLGNGLWYWQVRSMDEAGNKSSWSDVWKVMIDTGGPMIQLAQPVEGSLGSVVVPFEAVITDMSDLVSTHVELDGLDITSQLQQAPIDGGVKLQKEWQTGEMTEGAHTFRIIAKDIHGHISEVVRSFTVDSTPPQISTTIEEGQLLQGMVTLDLMADEAGTYAIRITKEDGGLLAQDDTEPQTESTSMHKRTWNTWKVTNGKYILTFTGKDTVGNESVIIRHVSVANAQSTGVVTAKDPLLEELSANLNQPLIAPYSTTPPRASVGNLPPVSDTVHSHDALLATVPEFKPVAATENGWRLFGILWYWWMLGGLLLASGMNLAWRLLRAPIQQMPDSV